ncbi:hypothetical protein DFR70_102156 [Nocardia tenerifensis]|uniref:Uncharacterized protein n=1 Tax=Nocardia tenerifensis TaxID=228006 RepID=A0A318K613_9NOCA|nr:hypothetical protein DFR70_102156 [Nocardia tenerifensis]
MATYVSALHGPQRPVASSERVSGSADVRPSGSNLLLGRLFEVIRLHGDVCQRAP